MAKVELDAWAGKTDKEIDEMCRAIQISLFSQIIQGTTVLTGALAGNWQTNVSRRPRGTTERKGRELSIREVEQKVVSGDVVFLGNNLPYAIVEERRKGMVAKALANIERNVRNEAKKYK